jgi:hypothetical protein
VPSIYILKAKSRQNDAVQGMEWERVLEVVIGRSASLMAIGIYTRKNAQVVMHVRIQNCCKQVVTRLLRNQMCSHCSFPVVVTSLEQLVVSPCYNVDDGNKLAKVVPTRLTQAVRYKLLYTTLLSSTC